MRIDDSFCHVRTCRLPDFATYIRHVFGPPVRARRLRQSRWSRTRYYRYRCSHQNLFKDKFRPPKQMEFGRHVQRIHSHGSTGEETCPYSGKLQTSHSGPSFSVRDISTAHNSHCLTGRRFGVFKQVMNLRAEHESSAIMESSDGHLRSANSGDTLIDRLAPFMACA